MNDLLEKECLVISTKCELLNLCSKYRIPNKGIPVAMFDLYSRGEQSAYLISRDGVREYDKNYPTGLTIFKTSESLKHYLFESALYNAKIVVHKSDYKTYLKTIRLLKRIGIKTIKDKTYFEEAYSFYVICGSFKELSLFGDKCIVSMANGIQYSSRDFLGALRDYIKNKDRFRKINKDI